MAKKPRQTQLEQSKKEKADHARPNLELAFPLQSCRVVRASFGISSM